MAEPESECPFRGPSPIYMMYKCKPELREILEERVKRFHKNVVMATISGAEPDIAYLLAWIGPFSEDYQPFSIDPRIGSYYTIALAFGDGAGLMGLSVDPNRTDTEPVLFEASKVQGSDLVTELVIGDAYFTVYERQATPEELEGAEKGLSLGEIIAA